MQLTSLKQPLIWLCFVGVLGISASAHADQIPQNPTGEVTLRGNYWRDRNTRVVNPTVDIRQELPNRVGVSAHYMLDAITSASIAAGVTADEPFTELRHEAGFAVDIPLPNKASLSPSYSYSTESDYFSHSAGLRGKFSLFQDNTALLFGVDYGHNTVAKRLGPTGYLLQGVLQTVHLVALATQVLSRHMLGSFSYEATVGSGYMNNPYRPVFVSGERREVENLPTFRHRHVLALSLHSMFVRDTTLIPYVTLRPALRLHLDSWGLKALNPELATYLPIGPVELRFLLSWYEQWAVDFYRSDGIKPQGTPDSYPSYGSAGVEWGTKLNPMGQEVPNFVYTSDVKMGEFSSLTAELQLKWRLSFFKGGSPILDRLARSVIEVSGGMWFTNRAVGWQFGIPLSGEDPSGPAGCSKVCAAGFAALGYHFPL